MTCSCAPWFLTFVSDTWAGEWIGSEEPPASTLFFNFKHAGTKKSGELLPYPWRPCHRKKL